jgi:hypothetical protein
MDTLFLKLIQPLAVENLIVMSENDFSVLKAQCSGHNLLPLVYTRLQKYQNIISPRQYAADFLNKSRDLFLKGITISARQEIIEKEIVALLREHDIPSVVIRGNAIAKEIYDDPNSRVSSDIDILIRLSDAIRADTVLSDAGYLRNDNLPLNFWFYRIHHAVYHNVKGENIIEIHWNFGIPSFFKLSSEEIWAGVFSTDSEYRLSPEMVMIMLLIHHHMHSFRELKILVDIVWAFRRYEDVIDWKTLFMKIRRIGLIKTTQITLSQIQMLWGKSIKEISPIWILLSELKRLRYKEPGLLLSLSRMDIDRDHSFQDYRDKLVARLALDNFSVMVFSFVKALFPVKEAIKALYDDQRNWTLPFNYLKFIKWRLTEGRGV